MLAVDRTPPAVAPIIGVPVLHTVRWTSNAPKRRFIVCFVIANRRSQLFEVSVSAATLLSFKRFRTEVAHQKGIVLIEPTGDWTDKLIAARQTARQHDSWIAATEILGVG